MRRRHLRLRRLAALGCLLAAATAWAADRVVVADWSAYPPGTKGIPDGWRGNTWGHPAYDFTVADSDGTRVLHLRSRGDSSSISKEIKGKVHLKETPVLEWSWRVVTLPDGGDARRKDRDDQAAQLYVIWPRFPQAVRSRIIGYVWDSTAPVGTIVKSQKTGTATYVVVRSGPNGLGQWHTERRNVLDDYRKIYGEDDDPGAIAVAIDSDDTKSSAESFFGSIVFKRP